MNFIIHYLCYKWNNLSKSFGEYNSTSVLKCTWFMTRASLRQWWDSVNSISRFPSFYFFKTRLEMCAAWSILAFQRCSILAVRKHCEETKASTFRAFTDKLHSHVWVMLQMMDFNIWKHVTGSSYFKHTYILC
jgi:hypothetical protein